MSATKVPEISPELRKRLMRALHEREGKRDFTLDVQPQPWTVKAGKRVDAILAELQKDHEIVPRYISETWVGCDWGDDE